MRTDTENHEFSIKKNTGYLLTNWYLLASAPAFYLLEADTLFAKIHWPALIIGELALAFVLGFRPGLLREALGTSRLLRIYTLFSALGTVAYGAFYMCRQALLGGTQHSPVLIAALAVLSFPFVCTYTGLILKYVTGRLARVGFLQDLTAAEKRVYALLAAATGLAVIAVYSKTEAFAGTDVLYDVLYNLDTPVLVNPDAGLFLTHLENDIRQPLFAVMASPFTGPSFLIGFPLSFVLPASQRITTGLWQAALLLMGDLMLARSMKLDAGRRILFTVLTFTSFGHMLFSLAVEQYAVGYFWIAFTLLMLSCGIRDDFAWIAATGSLVTNAALGIFYPDVAKKDDGRSEAGQGKRTLAGWGKTALRLGGKLAVCLAVFCRADTVYSCLERTSDLTGRFAGESLPFADRLAQYTAFLGYMFFGAGGFVDTVSRDHVSWQMEEVTGIHLTGVIIFALAIGGFLLNRDRLEARAAMLWVAMSVALLPVLGWGTGENGLILYSLYFLWAFLSLIFLLVDRLCDIFDQDWLLPTLTAVGAIAMILNSLPHIMELIRFGMEYYPG